MEKDKNISELTRSISGDFTKVGMSGLITIPDAGSLEELREYLIENLRGLLDKNFDQLINALYRIDISEEKLNKVFSETSREDIPPQLADLIIERQLQKIYFRQKYREGKL